MKILLVNPPVFSPWHMPAGITYLAGYLEKQGHNVKQRNLHVTSIEDILRVQFSGFLETLRNPHADVHNRQDWKQLYRSTLYLQDKELRARTSSFDRIIIQRNNVLYKAPSFYKKDIATLRDCIKQSMGQTIFDSSFKELSQDVVTESYDIVGISIADERQVVPACILAYYVKNSGSKSRIVLGGNFFSRMQHVFANETLVWFFEHCFDCLIYGEGYMPFEAIASGSDLRDVPSAVFLEKGKIIVTEKPLVPVDFKNIPAPSVFRVSNQWSPAPVPSLYYRAECPMQCAYCDISAGSDTFLLKSRSRVQNFHRHIETLCSNGITMFDITNETMLSQEVFSLKPLHNKYGIKFQNYMIVGKQMLEKDFCDRLYQSGLRSTQIGLETLSSQALGVAEKRWNKIDYYGEILKNLASSGIMVHVFIIVGLPGDSIKETLSWIPFMQKYGRYVTTIKAGRYRVSRLSPQVGSDIPGITIRPSVEQELSPNVSFQYNKGEISSSVVDDLRIIMEQLCRDHWAYKTTSCIPWGVNRMWYSLKELRTIASYLFDEGVPRVDDLEGAVSRLSKKAFSFSINNWESFKQMVLEKDVLD